MQTFHAFLAAHLVSAERKQSFSRLQERYLQMSQLQHPLSDEQITQAKAKHLAELEQRIADLEKRMAELENK